MEEEEREPQTLVPHTKKCLLLLFQYHCEVGVRGSGHCGQWALGRGHGAVGTRGSGHRGLQTDPGGPKKWEEKESAKTDL